MLKVVFSIDTLEAYSDRNSIIRECRIKANLTEDILQLVDGRDYGLSEYFCLRSCSNHRLPLLPQATLRYCGLMRLDLEQCPAFGVANTTEACLSHVGF